MKQTDILDLQRRIASLAELEHESEAEGNESMAAVWRARKKKAEALLEAMSKKGKKYAETEREGGSRARRQCRRS